MKIWCGGGPGGVIYLGRPFLGVVKCVTECDGWGRVKKSQNVRTSFVDGPISKHGLIRVLARKSIWEDNMKRLESTS